MKKIVTLILTISLFSCQQHNSNNETNLQNRIDSLETKLAETYKPGFGEFMGYVQAHHAKLWYAGENNNWDLAKFEIDEIKETMDAIKQYETDRKETQLLPMIYPALVSVDSAIDKKDPSLFKSSFTTLTNTCNACHQAAQFGFNVVKVPEDQMFSNQDFKPRK